MKKSLIAVGVVGLMGLTSVAMAAEFNWYGSLRAGVSNSDSKLDLGGGGKTNRVGIKASADLGNGLTAGAQLEYGVGNAGGDSLTLRRRNVSIGGGWGTLTFGEQGGIYRSAANWDQTYLLGGNIRHNDLDNAEGIRYSSNTGGPFSFDVFLVGEDGVERFAVAAHYNVGAVTFNLGYSNNSADSIFEVPAITGTARVDRVLSIETLSTIVTVTPAVEAVEAVEAVKAVPSYNAVAVSVNGSVGGFGYYVAYETNQGNDTLDGAGVADENTIGVFLSYGFGGNSVYLAQENDISGDKKDATLVGYSRSLGEGVTFIAEYLANPLKDGDAKPLQLVFKVDF